MDNIYQNVQISMLAFIQSTSQNLTTLVGTEVAPVNFDAHASDSTLPEGDLLGLESLAMTFAGDELASGSIIFTMATEGDANNMRISKAINHLVNKLQPAKSELPYYDEITEAQIGKIIVMGKTRVMPVDKSSSVKTYQSVGIQFAVLAYETETN